MGAAEAGNNHPRTGVLALAIVCSTPVQCELSPPPQGSRRAAAQQLGEPRGPFPRQRAWPAPRPAGHPHSLSWCGAAGHSPASQATRVRLRRPRQASAFAGIPAPACRSSRRCCREARWRRPCHSCTPARRRGCAASTSACTKREGGGVEAAMSGPARGSRRSISGQDICMQQREGDEAEGRECSCHLGCSQQAVCGCGRCRAW